MTVMQSTRWWWVRHAPVTVNDGHLYGASDPPAELGDEAAFTALAAALPGGAVWVTSHLRRTRETAAAIRARGLDGEAPIVEPGIGEQCFGDWQGMRYDAVAELAGKPRHRFWFTTPEHRPPGGESFLDLMARTGEAIERLGAAHAGRDIVAVSHGGPIRAAIARALGLEADGALSFVTDNLSLTRLDQVSHPDRGPRWQVQTINRPPRSLSGAASGSLA